MVPAGYPAPRLPPDGADATASLRRVGEPVVWLNGAIVPEAEARVSPRDHGLLVGDGVFESVRITAGQAFAVGRHLARLARSAGALGLELPPAGELREAVAGVLAASGVLEGRLRITATSGPGGFSSARPPAGTTVVVAAEEAPPWSPHVAVITVPWPRNERGATAGIKTISYAENVLALQRAHAAGAGEAIFANTRGELCEGTGTNVFLVLGGRLLTPPLSVGCLAGVTRDLALEITEATPETVPLAALAEASEAFLTSTTRNVHPISAVDGVSLPACPGPATIAAQQAFAALMAETLDP
ncbi:MAG: aminotransferase class IV [Acidimicrobiia bacterium]|nr:aminotransferase class IV [Acidimicrobiia bacterium]